MPSAEWAYLRRIEALPPDTRRALLLAALADSDDRATVARAGATLSLDPLEVGLEVRVDLCHARLKADHTSSRLWLWNS